MRIAIIGFGGVGQAFIQLLVDKKEILQKEGLDIQVIYIIGKSGGIYNAHGIDLVDLIAYMKKTMDYIQYPNGGSRDIDFNLLMERKDVDLVIEATPTNKETGEPGMTHIAKSLASGFHVITANKGPILIAYKMLKKLAKKHNVQLCIGCTTGGALPTINAGMIDLAGAVITSIEGVLNGTTNFIINEMEQRGVSYNEALKKAQELGIAETDPTLDVKGWDTATKLLILTNVLMDEQKKLEDVTVEGITDLTADEVQRAAGEGKKYKLIGKTIKENGSLQMTVRLEKLDQSHPLYGVDGKNKAVRYISDTLGELTVIGGASGVTPAAASLLRDLINLNRGCRF